jgi:hypothetical protein
MGSAAGAPRQAASTQQSRALQRRKNRRAKRSLRPLRHDKSEPRRRLRPRRLRALSAPITSQDQSVVLALAESWGVEHTHHRREGNLAWSRGTDRRDPAGESSKRKGNAMNRTIRGWSPQACAASAVAPWHAGLGWHVSYIEPTHCTRLQPEGAAPHCADITDSTFALSIPDLVSFSPPIVPKSSRMTRAPAR